MKATDRILIENGIMFEGTRDQFRDCFFDNATDDQIKSWCESEEFDLHINDAPIIDTSVVVTHKGAKRRVKSFIIDHLDSDYFSKKFKDLNLPKHKSVYVKVFENGEFDYREKATGKEYRITKIDL